MTPELAEDGTVLSVLGVSRDITQITKASDDLRKMNEELVASHEETKESQKILKQKIDELTLAEEALRRANRKLNLLSSITRHDINNQTVALKGHLALLLIKHPNLATDDG